MRPCIRAVVLVLLASAPANAGFTLRLEDKELQPNQADQTVDLFLSTSVAAQISGMHIGAYIGNSANAVAFGSVPPAFYRDPEGNFQSSVPTGGVQWNGGGHFWELPGAFAGDQSGTWWGHNVAITELKFGEGARDAPDYRELSPADGEVKVATFHLDTTGVSASTLKLSLYDPGNDLNLNHDNSDVTPDLELGTTSVTTFGGSVYSIAFSSQLQFVGGDAPELAGGISYSKTYNIASTPEPAFVGFAGLGLMGGLGWLRAKRKRKTAQ